MYFCNSEEFRFPSPSGASFFLPSLLFAHCLLSIFPLFSPKKKIPFGAAGATATARARPLILLSILRLLRSGALLPFRLVISPVRTSRDAQSGGSEHTRMLCKPILKFMQKVLILFAAADDFLSARG